MAQRSGGRPTDRDEWPADGPHRKLLEHLDQVRVDNGTKGLRPIAKAMSLDSPTRVSDILKGRSLHTGTEQLGLLVKALGGGTDDVKEALRLDELRLKAGAAGPTHRVRAPDRASLEPEWLPLVPRPSLLDSALATRDRQSEGEPRRQVLALVGDGGIGKSVLLGQMLNRIEESGLAAVLVSSAAVLSAGLPATPLEADAFFGQAVEPYSGRGLGAILHDHAREHGRVTLLVDTLDLVLNRSTVIPITTLLQTATDHAEVVFTCRDQEFHSFLAPLRGRDRLGNRLSQFPVPSLDPAEIVDWAERYLATRRDVTPADRAGFLDSLRGGVSGNGRLRTLCALPVRLAMTCDVFGAHGHVPEDLTATRLYQAYWRERISRHTGLDGTDEGRGKNAAALALGERYLNKGVPNPRVPKGDLPEDLDSGLRLLVSEGVVREHLYEWEFFHQNFAEFAHGRALLTQGVGSAGVRRLAEAVRQGGFGVWSVATSLMLQADDSAKYRALAEALPIDGPAGAQAHVVAALQQDDGAALDAVLARIRPWPDLLGPAVPVLGDAPRHQVPAAHAALADAVTRHPEELAKEALAALGRLIPRAEPGVRAAQLTSALEAWAAMNPRPPGWDHLPARLLTPLQGDDLVAECLQVMCENLAHLGVTGRQAVTRVHLAAALTEEQALAFGRAALAVDRPTLDETEAADVGQLLWDCAPLRAERGWTTWREFLGAPLRRNWKDTQMRLVTRWTGDETVRGEVVDHLLAGVGDVDERHVVVLKNIARAHPHWLADRLLGSPPPVRPRAGILVQGIGLAAPHLDVETRARFTRWLGPLGGIEPRAVRPTQVVLAGDALDMHRDVLNDLAGAARAVVRGSAQAWAEHAPPEILGTLRTDLRALLPGRDSDTMEVRARLEGRLATADPRARAWLTRAVLRGPSPKVAGTGALTLSGAVGSVPERLVTWVFALLFGPHGDATKNIAKILADPERVGRDDFRRVAGHRTRILARIEDSVGRGEEATVLRELVEVLIRADRVHGLDQDQVLRVYALARDRIVVPPRRLTDDEITQLSTGIATLAAITGALLPGRVPRERIRELASEFLTGVDLDRIGTKIRKVAESLLVGIGQRDPLAVGWLVDGLFGHPGLGAGARMAVANAVVALDKTEQGVMVVALLNHPVCPPEVARVLLRDLRRRG
ncbi:hypothetical protein [Herbidospora cretacea]|uniref:hypothetical protein n=1 Tax=Herbidospora cretacea TaxID=28444 RepID=UPI0007749831|nr:hypothetical protein [Herbidospora cretacea]